MKMHTTLFNINKKAKLSIAASLIAIMASSSLYAQVPTQTNIPVCVQNKQVNLGSESPYISNRSQAMIPIRAVGRVLGVQVSWQAPYVVMSGRNVKTGEVVTVKANTSAGTLTANGTTLSNAIAIRRGRSYVSLRVLAEVFGYNVNWRNGRVDIQDPKAPTTPKAPTQPTTPSTPKAPTQPTTPSTPKAPTTPQTPTEPKAPQTPSAPTNNSVVAYENKVLELVNVERQKAGLSALKMDESLRNVARMKSQDMQTNKYFDHNSPTYGSPFDMMKKFGITYKSAGENIAMGQRTPEEVVTAWMNSPGHRANILKSSFTHIGVGYVANGNYWTQEFVGR